ncbi:unnamed protein product, partial [Meganyctiphanes norvegica]
MIVNKETQYKCLSIFSKENTSLLLECLQNVNECLDNNGGCDQICTNVIGSFNCSCDVGSYLDGDQKSCKDPRPIIFNGAGTAHSTSVYSSSYNAKYAFDENRSSYWASRARTTYPQSIWFEFNDPVVIVKFAFRSTSNTNEMIPNGPSKYEFF